MGLKKNIMFKDSGFQKKLSDSIDLLKRGEKRDFIVEAVKVLFPEYNSLTPETLSLKLKALSGGEYIHSNSMANSSRSFDNSAVANNNSVEEEINSKSESKEDNHEVIIERPIEGSNEDKIDEAILKEDQLLVYG